MERGVTVQHQCGVFKQGIQRESGSAGVFPPAARAEGGHRPAPAPLLMQLPLHTHASALPSVPGGEKAV